MKFKSFKHFFQDFSIFKVGLDCSIQESRPKKSSGTECDEYIRILEYICHEYLFGHLFLLIFSIKIYSDICLYHFLDMNIFGYSFVSKSYSGRVWRIFKYSNIRVILDTKIHSINVCIISFHTNIFGQSFISLFWYKCIRIFVRIVVLLQIY